MHVDLLVKFRQFWVSQNLAFLRGISFSTLQFETTAAEVLASLRSKVANETGEMEEPDTGDVQIFLSSKENSVSMRSIGVGARNFLKFSTFSRFLFLPGDLNLRFLGGVHVKACENCWHYNCCF